MKKKYPMSRENWIKQMYDFGERGIDDFNHTAEKIIPASKKLIKKTQHGPRLKKLDSTLDVKSYDMPRDDVTNIKLKNQKIIRVGSDNQARNIQYFKKFILPYINQAFTEKELQGLELYIEYPSKKLSKKWLGLHLLWRSDKNKKFSTIELGELKDGYAAVHEILHAVRFQQHRLNPRMSVNKDEAETELESMARISPRRLSKVPCNDGYYDLLKGDKCKARKEDVAIIKKNCNLRDKHGLTKCIRKNLKKTHIGKLKIPKKYQP